MRPFARISAPPIFVLLAAATLVPIAPPSALAAQAAALPADSSDIVDEARDRQEDFEFFRQSRIPVERASAVGPRLTWDLRRLALGGCDERLGRICIWFGGEEEEDFPPEFAEVADARDGLIAYLSAAADRISDPWITGQLVHYLAERGDYRGAERAARECDLTEAWWCSALLGYALHLQDRFVEAEAAFREAVATMPDDELERWAGGRYILTEDGADALEEMDPDLYWRLSDPLYLLDGNDRLTDHWARWVEATNQRDATTPQLMEWEEDLEATLVRYGRIRGWSRTHQPEATFRRPGGFQPMDTRQVVGHHHPGSRGYLFPEAYLESPSDIPPESWITAPRESRTWYAPPYAPDFRGLSTQVGRFRRGDEMLVVGAYRIGESASGPVQSGLFLVPEDGGPAPEVRGTEAGGVLTLRAAPGRYVSSLEVLEAERRRAWRARQGVRQVPLSPGIVAVSDLMILDEGAPFPTSLEEAIPHVRPGVTIDRDERFTVVWEVYGLRVQESPTVTIGFTRGRPGFLARVGDFLGIIEPESPVQITFEDAESDQVQSAFRALEMEFPELEPGEYTLHLRIELPGREPAIASRPVIIEP